MHSSQAGLGTDLGVLVVQLALQAIDKHGVGQGLRQLLFKLCQVLCWQGAQHERPPWLQAQIKPQCDSAGGTPAAWSAWLLTSYMRSLYTIADLK